MATKEQLNQYKETIVERGKEVVAEGNKRYLVVRKPDGTEWFQTSLTVAVGVGLAALVLQMTPLVIIAAVALYIMKYRAEIRHEQ